MTSHNPSNPIRDVADNQSDPLTSPDNLTGVQDRFRNLSHSSASPADMSSDLNPSRPEKSSARGGAAGVMGSIGGAANGAYNRAPDLGITNAANNAYQRAPDLGVSSTLNRVMGYSNAKTDGQTANSNGGDDEQGVRGVNDSQQQSGGGGGGSSSNSSSGRMDGFNSRREETERKGPSDEKRLGKSQGQIGTEIGVPTAAGLGSTASPDTTNLRAIEKAESKGNIHQAIVPEDYVRQPGSTDGAAPSGHAATSRRSGSQKGQQPSSPRRSGQSSPRSQIITSDGSPLEMEKRRSLGEKVRDQIKGEMKILASTVTRSDDKIIQGLAIKHGDHHT